LAAAKILNIRQSPFRFFLVKILSRFLKRIRIFVIVVEGKGTNVLFNDSHVEFCKPERLEELNIWSNPPDYFNFSNAKVCVLAARSINFGKVCSDL